MENTSGVPGSNDATRDGYNQSPWQEISSSAAPGVKDTIGHIYDVLIIGGGITGLTTALQAQNAGKQCIVVDAHTVGFGTTGGTSAHINTFADTTYKEAQSAFGIVGAQLFADAINDGFTTIRQNIETYKIDCDFETKNGYVYAEDDQQVDELEKLFEGVLDVGVPAHYTTAVPVAIPYKKALVFENQAQFHPVKYLDGLQLAFLRAGGLILEQTKISGLRNEDDVHIAVVDDGRTIRARHVIYATHIPPGINILSFRCAPYRSYVLGVTLQDGNYPDALVYDMQEPYHYFRTHEINGQKYLIAGGNDHKTGHDDPEQAFDELEQYVRKYFKVSELGYKWSSQYYVPVDGFPYIGRMPGAESIYCATGYNGNGMMLGSVAARILTDLVTGRENKYAEVFSPARMKPVAGFKDFVRENADVVYQFIASRLSAQELDSLKALRNDTGKIVEFDGRKIAVYRDKEGAFHGLNPVCTHAGCIVNWNGEEKSWDCPCHGARYDINGTVLTGPADRDLEKVIL